MSKKHRLVQRKGVWYYRRRVPLPLVPVIGKKVIQFSLKTKDLSEAAKLRTLADLEWDAKFQEAEKAKENGTTLKTNLSRSEALQMVREYLEAKDRELKTLEDESGALTKEQIQDAKFEDGMDIQILEDTNNPEADAMVP